MPNTSNDPGQTSAAQASAAAEDQRTLCLNKIGAGQASGLVNSDGRLPTPDTDTNPEPPDSSEGEEPASDGDEARVGEDRGSLRERCDDA